MKRRTFIAINLTENIKKKLVQGQEIIEKLFVSCRNEVFCSGPIKWTKGDNLHITLVFLGYLANEELLEICKITKETALQHSPFLIDLKKILYGPPKKMPPRMVWAEGEKSSELGRIQKDLENSLFPPISLAKENLTLEVKPYIPHITLGRIKQWEFRRIEPEERPEINEEIDLNFEVNSIEIMESQLKRSGPEYIILESFPLSKDI